jgi:hypothetical protein
MKKAKRRTVEEMLPEYDFRGGTRGKYAAAYASGKHVVVLARAASALNHPLGSVILTFRSLATPALSATVPR